MYKNPQFVIRKVRRRNHLHCFWQFCANIESVCKTRTIHNALILLICNQKCNGKLEHMFGLCRSKCLVLRWRNANDLNIEHSTLYAFAFSASIESWESVCNRVNICYIVNGSCDFRIECKAFEAEKMSIVWLNVDARFQVSMLTNFEWIRISNIFF